MLERILAAIDNSKEGARALRFAIELSCAVKADLKVITVLQPLPSYFSFTVSAVYTDEWKQAQSAKCNATQVMAMQEMVLSGLNPDAELVAGDQVSEFIRRAKGSKADLLVLGMRHSKFVRDRTLQDVIERSPCAVVGVP